MGGESRERTGILPCRGQLEKGVRCSCVGLLGTGDPAGVTAGKRGTGTPRAHRAHDLTGQLMGCKGQGGREANDKSPWEGRKAMTFFHIHLFYSLLWTWVFPPWGVFAKPRWGLASFPCVTATQTQLDSSGGTKDANQHQGRDMDTSMAKSQTQKHCRDFKCTGKQDPLTWKTSDLHRCM